MKPDRLAGLALIVGALGMVVTMAFHPTGGSLEKIVRQANRNITVHVLAIAFDGLLLFGFLRWARTTVEDRPYVDAGLVAFAFAAAAGALAPILNGIVIQGLAERAMAAEPAAQPGWKLIMTYNHMLGGALAQVLIAGSSAAMLIWSLGMLRIGGSWTYLGAAGIVVGILGLLALFSGHVLSSVHHFGLFVLGLAGWTTALGILLCGSAETNELGA